MKLNQSFADIVNGSSLPLVEPQIQVNILTLFSKSGLLFRLFSVFSNKQTIQFLQQINVKNVHPVCGAGIRTHDILNTSRLPQPLDNVATIYGSVLQSKKFYNVCHGNQFFHTSADRPKYCIVERQFRYIVVSLGCNPTC